MKKALAILLSTLLIFATLMTTACNKETTTEPASEQSSQDTTEDSSPEDTPTKETGDLWDYEKDTSDFEFTLWWAAIWPWAKKSVENGWPDTGVTQHIYEKTGVKMNIEIPVGTENELLGPLIASGSYPDAMTFGSYGNPYIQQMKEAGSILNLTELMDEYAPRMYELITPSLIPLHGDEDGNLWYYSGFEYDERGTEALVEVGLPPTLGATIKFVRGDILDAFGKDDIRDLDTYNEFLEFTKENFPDVSPIRVNASNVDAYYRSVFGMHPSLTYPDGDQLKIYQKDPAYLDYVKWLNELYHKGIISEHTLTEDSQAMDEKYWAGQYASFIDGTFHVLGTLNTTLEENYGTTDMAYRAIGPIEKEGVPFVIPTIRNKGGLSTVITDQAEQPDRIIRFLEYLLTEDGQVATVLGLEGETWEEVDGKRVMLEKNQEELLKDLQEYAAEYNVLGRWTPWVKSEYWSLYCDDYLTPTGPIREDNQKRLEPFAKDIWEEGFVDITGSIIQGSDESVVITKVNEIHPTYLARMITAKDDAEIMKYYEEFLAEAEALGVGTVEAAYTEEYHKNLALLGK